MPTKKNESIKEIDTKAKTKSAVKKTTTRATTAKSKVVKEKVEKDSKIIEKTKTSKKSSTTKKISSVKKAATKKEASPKTATKKTNLAKGSSTAKRTTAVKGASSKKSSTSTKGTTASKRKKSSSKINTSSIEYYDLPTNYNQTIVSVLFQTPKKLFVYWEVSEKDKEKYMLENGNDFFTNSTPFLVVKNVTKNYSFEIQINDYANSWYFDVPDSNCEYHVDLIRKNNITYVPVQITSSNSVEVPNNHILFEQARREVFFKNVKTNEITSKDIANLHFIKYAGKVHSLSILNAFYNKFYDEKNLYTIDNPSSY